MAGKQWFTKASAEREFMKIGNYGKTGSGKTLTSLLFAEGLVGRDGGRIAYIDTERGTSFYDKHISERTIHPEPFDFDRFTTRSLFDVVEAVEELDPKTHTVLVIDSITHLWDAAKASYTGKMTSKGGIPVQAWGPIKKPYKRLMSLFLDGDYHAILCGREGVEMEDDDEGELKVVGKKMKAEGETAYEPHVLIQMRPRRDEDGTHIISAFFEKDRSGILTGRTVDWPRYATIEPIVNILAGNAPSQKLGTPEANAEHDSEARDRQKEAEEADRKELFEGIRSAITSASDLAQLKEAWKLTVGKKTKLGEDNFSALDTLKDARKTELVKAA